MATEDKRYRESSQFRLWSFSPGQLADVRSKTNSLAKLSISDRLSSSTASSSASASASANPSGSNTPNPTIFPSTGTASAPADVDPTAAEPSQTSAQPLKQPPGAMPLPEFLTPFEEAHLLRFYTVELLRAADFFRMPTTILATCAVFLRRFYITNSIMTYPPAELLKTCLFFGSKAEGSYQKLATFADALPKTTAEGILAGEFLLCQGIRFVFDVRHPYRALEGALMELRGYGDVDVCTWMLISRDVLLGGSLTKRFVAQEKRIRNAHGRARDILKFSPLVTDAYFHYTPSQIMLAALSMADRTLAERLVQGTFPPHHAATDQLRDKVMATIEACREMLATEPPERMSEYWGTVRQPAIFLLVMHYTNCLQHHRLSRTQSLSP